MTLPQLHPSWLTHKIVHIDMDCFFAAVEVLDQPKLSNKAVIVGGRENRGVVCAASYEARKFGVRSAMPIVTARKLCPKGIVLPVRMQRYREISTRIHEIFSRYTDLIQPISLDEAFLDVTHNKKNLPFASKVAKQIQSDILNELQLVASAGVAPNRFLAKIASDLNKPNGFKVVRPEDIEALVKELPIRRIWGIGPSMGQKMLDLGVHSAGDLQQFDSEFLTKHFGSMGRRLFELCRGIDQSPVKVPSRPKSIGREITLREDSQDIPFLKEQLRPLCKAVMERLLRRNLCPESISLKLKTSDFQVMSRSVTPQNEIQNEEDLYGQVCQLLDGLHNKDIAFRLIGLSVQRFKDHFWQDSEPEPFGWLKSESSPAHVASTPSIKILSPTIEPLTPALVPHSPSPHSKPKPQP